MNEIASAFATSSLEDKPPATSTLKPSNGVPNLSSNPSPLNPFTETSAPIAPLAVSDSSTSHALSLSSMSSGRVDEKAPRESTFRVPVSDIAPHFQHGSNQEAVRNLSQEEGVSTHPSSHSHETLKTKSQEADKNSLDHVARSSPKVELLKEGHSANGKNKGEIRFKSKETWSGPCQIGIREPRVRPSYVAKSAFCAMNPFRVQSFTDFVMDPIYGPPKHIQDYKAVTTVSDMDGAHPDNLDSVQAAKAQIRQLTSAPFHPVGKATLDEMIVFLCAGDLFFKWPSMRSSDNRKYQRRYFWLDGKRCSLMWSLPGVLITFSQLRLQSVEKVTTDCITVHDRVLYRMILFSKDVLVFGTPHRILFDQWYAVLQYIISPNALHGAPGLWQRPSAVPITRVGHWESRYSPLYAELLDAKQKEPKLYQNATWSD